MTPATFNPADFGTETVTKEFIVIPEDGTPVYYRFETAFAVDPNLQNVGRRGKNKDGSEAEQAPPEIAEVVNMLTGEVARLIGPEVVKSELRKTYPNDGYVGQIFEIKQGTQKTGKSGNKYRTYKINRMVPKAAAPTSSANEAPAPQHKAQPVGARR